MADDSRISEDDLAELARIRELLRAVPEPLAMLEGIFAFAPFGLQVYSVEGRSLFVNRAFRELFRSEPPPEYNLFKDEIVARSGLLPLAQRAFQGETLRTPPFWYDPRGLQHVTVEQGARVAIETWIFPLLGHENQVTHVAIVTKDVTAELSATEAVERETQMRRAAERARERVLRLQQVTSALASAFLEDEVARVVLELALSALDMRRGVIHRVSSDGLRLELLACTGFDDSQRAALASIALQFPAPSTFAVRSGQPQWLESDRDIARLFPAFSRKIADWSVTQLVAMPLATGGDPFGVITFDFAEHRALDAEDRDFVLAFSRQGAQALERARLYREAREAAARAEEASRAKDEFLSVLSHELRTP
ncbi:MAG TPA: GAF domain-containing protein, partial [Polyangiaceae bacterium]|nr:GAF domain-containing protein [Polyangiaceae bacterium]